MIKELIATVVTCLSVLHMAAFAIISFYFSCLPNQKIYFPAFLPLVKVWDDTELSEQQAKRRQTDPSACLIALLPATCGDAKLPGGKVYSVPKEWQVEHPGGVRSCARIRTRTFVRT